MERSAAKIRIADARELARRLIKEEEGLLLRPEPDVRGGVPRIGYGCECPPGMTEISKKRAETLLERALDVAFVDANAYLGHLMASLSPTRIAVIVSMAFNMGRGDLMTYVNLHDALERCDYTGAGFEIFDSARVEQIPGRVRREAVMMRNGVDKMAESRL